MKKTLALISITILLFTAVIPLSGCTNAKMEEGKVLVGNYYEAFKNFDIDTITGMFSSETIANFGSTENLQIFIKYRMGLLGTDVDYKITNVSYQKSNGVDEVLIETDATYNRVGETYVEKFMFQTVDDSLIITNMYYEDNTIVSNFVGQFFTLYNNGDKEAFLGLFSDAFFNYTTEEFLLDMIEKIYDALGDFSAYEQSEGYFYYDVYADEDIIVLYEGIYEVLFDDTFARLDLKLCLEDEELKISYISYVPEDVLGFAEAYFERLGDKDYDSILSIYGSVFYDTVEGGEDYWRETLEMLEDFGEYKGYSLVNWFHDEVQLNDLVYPTYNITVYMQYGDTIFSNAISYIDNETKVVTYHTITIEE